MYQWMKPYKSSEISSITMTHWRNCPAGRSHHGIAGSLLRTTYFQVNDKFFQQKNGMAIGSFLTTTVSNMEHFEKLAFDLA
jgi:hypothetical protein